MTWPIWIWFNRIFEISKRSDEYFLLTFSGLKAWSQTLCSNLYIRERIQLCSEQKVQLLETSEWNYLFWTIYIGTSQKRPPLCVILNQRWSPKRGKIIMIFKDCQENYAVCVVCVRLSWAVFVKGFCISFVWYGNARSQGISRFGI